MVDSAIHLPKKDLDRLSSQSSYNFLFHNFLHFEYCKK